jgi:hypothetical protein
MSSPLEKFIQENREKFDSDIPDPKIWDKITERMNPTENKKTAPLRSLPFKRWLFAAAAVVILGLTTVLYFSMRQHQPQTGIAETKPVKSEPSISQSIGKPGIDTSVVIAKTEPNSISDTHPTVENPEPSDLAENKEMYYYAKLIELKHEELKTLEKDEPLLYKQFSGDVQKLDSVYHTLKNQLPNTSNREQMIEAMISNLQMQIGLLNKQLNIIKQIKHSKKSAYEQAYKSV